MTKFMRLVLLIFSMFLLLSLVCKEEKPTTKEGRGLWVTRWEWAIQSGSDLPASQQQRIIDIFDDAKQAKLNFIVFQIRGNGDAFYRSTYEPWSDLLTGTWGNDPGWDPLAFAVEQAHARGLELHAWFNTFPAWRGTSPPPHTIPEHVYNAHPEWIVCDSSGKPMPLSEHYVSLSPGIPEAREYIQQVAMDIVTHYDIDGFHFDYIRYPESADRLGYSQDPVSIRLFNSPDGNPKNLNWADWQRENINQFVRQFYDEATALKPWLKISAAVIGKYDYSSWNGYHIVFQDAKQWIDEKKMDFIAPMIYWQTNHATAPYGTIVKNWFHLKHDRYIFPGMMINNLGTENWTRDEVVRQVAINREGGNGMVFFSYGGLEKAKAQLKGDGFRAYANLPPMSWKDDKPPMDPRNLRANVLSTGHVLLIWSPPDSSVETADLCHYNIFRSEKKLVDFMNAENLIYITAKPDTFFVDTTIQPGKTYRYIVTALDRVNNESPPSNQVSVLIPQLAVTDATKNSTSE